MSKPSARAASHTTLACTPTAAQRAEHTASEREGMHKKTSHSFSLSLSAAANKSKMFTKEAQFEKFAARRTAGRRGTKISIRSVASIERVQVKQRSISSKYALNRGKKHNSFSRRRPSEQSGGDSPLLAAARENFSCDLLRLSWNNIKKSEPRQRVVYLIETSERATAADTIEQLMMEFLCLCRRNCFN